MRREELRKLLGRRVRSRRLELGLTQTDLGEKLGAKQPSVAALEHGHSAVSLDMIGRLAEALHTTPSALLSTEEIFLAKSS